MPQILQVPEQGITLQVGLPTQRNTLETESEPFQRGTMRVDGGGKDVKSEWAPEGVRRRVVQARRGDWLRGTEDDEDEDDDDDVDDDDDDDDDDGCQFELS
eukprot:2959329-Rhodomonas_salina.1